VPLVNAGVVLLFGRIGLIVLPHEFSFDDKMGKARNSIRLLSSTAKKHMRLPLNENSCASRMVEVVSKDLPII
jgi:hypothetical protein